MCYAVARVRRGGVTVVEFIYLFRLDVPHVCTGTSRSGGGVSEYQDIPQQRFDIGARVKSALHASIIQSFLYIAKREDAGVHLRGSGRHPFHFDALHCNNIK